MLSQSWNVVGACDGGSGYYYNYYHYHYPQELEI